MAKDYGRTVAGSHEKQAGASGDQANLGNARILRAFGTATPPLKCHKCENRSTDMT